MEEKDERQLFKEELLKHGKYGHKISRFSAAYFIIGKILSYHLISQCLSLFFHTMAQSSLAVLFVPAQSTLPSKLIS